MVSGGFGKRKMMDYAHPSAFMRYILIGSGLSYISGLTASLAGILSVTAQVDGKHLQKIKIIHREIPKTHRIIGNEIAQN